MKGYIIWRASPLKTASTKSPTGSARAHRCPPCAHIAKGAAITIERENDKDAVVSLREIAEKTISAGDMRDGLIHSIQKEVEIDEPEAAAAPILPSQSPRATLGRDDPATDVIVDTMTEDELLRGLERLTPEESMVKGEAASAGARGSRY